jgi:glutamyl/glutaminyl-tRNA synthetase
VDKKALYTRFAPTPSGFLHTGNGISFITTWAIARAFNGKILLRIDDLDADRMRSEYVEDIFYTLDWLGLDYDSGPTSPDDFNKNYSQHHRLEMYFQDIKQLQETGLLYECHCSRRDIQRDSVNGLYPNTCRNNTLKPTQNHQKDTAWRIKVEKDTFVDFNEWHSEVKPVQLDAEMGDFIVLQKNGLPAYQVASLMDDAHFNINFVVRGQDLLHSTAAQMYLAQVIGNESFPKMTFFHHSLVKNTVPGTPDGEGVKLSKSKNAEALSEWRKIQLNSLPLFKKAAEWLNLDSELIEKKEDLIDLIQQNYTF